jgi:hypothetical protein
MTAAAAVVVVQSRDLVEPEHPPDVGEPTIELAAQPSLERRRDATCEALAREVDTHLCIDVRGRARRERRCRRERLGARASEQAAASDTEKMASVDQRIARIDGSPSWTCAGGVAGTVECGRCRGSVAGAG